MEGALEALKQQCQLKPAKSFAEVETGFHEVIGLKNLKTKYGDKICVEFDEYVMFLPERIKMNEKCVDEMNAYVEGDKGKLFMNFIGRHGDKKNGAVLLDFEKADFNAVDESSDDSPPSTPTPAQRPPKQLRKK